MIYSFKTYVNIRLIFLITCLITASSHVTFGSDQFNPDSSDFKKTNNEEKKNKAFNALLLSFDYSTNTNTFGSFTQEVKQPNYSPSLLFFSKTGLTFSAISFFIENSDSTFTKTTSEHDLMLGYNFAPAEKISIFPSYGHIFNSKNSNSLKSVFHDFLMLDISYNSKYYYGGVSANYFFGDKNMFYQSFQNALQFNFENVLFKNSALMLQLEADLNISDKNYYNEFYLQETISSLTREGLLDYVSYRFPRFSNWLISHIDELDLDQLKQTFFEKTLEDNPELYESRYTFTSLDLVLPVYYMIGNISFNVTLYAVFPLNTSYIFEESTQLYLNAGISYSFGF
ncbi:MAG: hypothetical protein JXJ22_00015 [Bacteroidales bacterium]|nr:hypothetical protein [Bacteroidales bacterium]